jgi:predicted PurR-regulated permease PerM
MAEETIRLAEMRQQRILVPSIVNDLDEMLAGYIRAQLLLAGLSLAVYTGVLLIMRVPYAVILGVLAGVAEFVPVVGPLVAAVSIFGVAFLSNYGFQTSFLLMAKLRAAGDYFRIADNS